MSRRARLAAGALLAGVIAAAAIVVSPDVVLDRLTWLAADPVRFGAALVLLSLVRPFLAWPTSLLALLAGYGYGLAGVPIALALMGVGRLDTEALA
ncbi:MAG: TVP38/TMEM64 family protein, partial [Haloferacaceae archaeon]